MFEQSKFEPEQKCTAKYKDLDDVLFLWLRQGKEQIAPISSQILMTKADALANGLGLSIPGWNSSWEGMVLLFNP